MKLEFIDEDAEEMSEHTNNSNERGGFKDINLNSSQQK